MLYHNWPQRWDRYGGWGYSTMNVPVKFLIVVFHVLILKNGINNIFDSRQTENRYWEIISQWQWWHEMQNVNWKFNANWKLNFHEDKFLHNES